MYLEDRTVAEIHQSKRSQFYSNHFFLYITELLNIVGMDL